ncbi:MAG TPA: PD-(D/E)XK nuclease family protein, partial [Vicinamibacterales bacterium]|nr:PD-(D/E)XK nuclease family protein [Vicinamibacterales bacterium]
RVCVSSLNADRLKAARDLVRGCAPGTRVLIVGSTRAAADDLAREAAAGAPATFGVQRLSLTQLAARSAIVTLAVDGRTPGTALGAEAVAARAAFDATRERTLKYFGPVASTPGFPRALARTLEELRLAGVDAAGLTTLPRGGSDLADLLQRVDACFEGASSADRAELFRTATLACRQSSPASVLVLLDLGLDQPAERAFVETIVAGAETTLATMPASDHDGIGHLRSMGGVVETHPDDEISDLACLRTFLFSPKAPGGRSLDGSLNFFSAPGEGREAVEIARRILREARAGVRFDEMAILVRSPQNYVGLIEHALRRAMVPAWFGRGTRRPHPAGRAFLALLACRSEQLSASRFAEYLSFAQVPLAGVHPPPAWAASHDEAFGRVQEPVAQDDADAGEVTDGNDSEPVVAGTLRAPWRWEGLLVDAAVIGQDATRWKRRLAGKYSELERHVREAKREDGGNQARVDGLRQVQAQLRHLEAFALPVIEEMSGWPSSATWGDWLDRFQALAPRVLRTPSHVMRVLADLRPMGEVGPITLDEARRVLADRLLTLESEPPAQRYGRVFIGTPQQARGRSFRVVFVPGLAERMFPQKPREDPLMLDTVREATGAPLPTQRQRLASERLLLQLAAGAASDRLYVSYPRIELSESRARVPSFYALDVMRAATGQVPEHEVLEQQARTAGDATLAWPAPTDPAEAIDNQEHDLAVLRRLLDDTSRGAVKGHAHYLLKLNECLRRSVVDQWARGERRWSPSDGLTRVQPYTKAALAAQRLSVRSYSASALQLFTACPYQFVLSAMYRLRPFEPPEPLQRMDPMTRGSLFHEIQAAFFHALTSLGALPVTATGLDEARAVLGAIVEEVGARAHDELAPAVERVWEDELSSIRRDLHAWLDHLAHDGEQWLPSYFEFGFGKVPGERDAHSVRDDVVLDGRFRLRGAVDLIEEHMATRVLRVTDHKTGRKPERIERVTIGGGAVLQPVLYAMAVEAALGREVSHGRLFYCTAAGSFHEHGIPLDDRTRAAGLEVLEIVDRAIESGFLAAAPTVDACGRCDFRPVCGSNVVRRVARKPQDKLFDLIELRSRP